MKIAIVGSQGFIGRHLTESFRHDGAELHLFSSRAGTGINPASGLLYPEFRLPRGLDAVYYLAQSPFYRAGSENAEHLKAVNVNSAVQIAKLAAETACPKFIYTSSANVYAKSFDPQTETCPTRDDNPYSKTKFLAETELAQLNQEIEVVIPRLFGIFGPAQREMLIPNLATRIAAGAPILLEPNPTQPQDQDGLRISALLVSDAVQILKTFAHTSGISLINVAGPEALSIRLLATAIAKQLEIATTFETAPAARTTDFIADISYLKEKLNPAFTPFQEAIRMTIDELKPLLQKRPAPVLNAQKRPD
ncbi:MAG: NAD(P)-dependent oxidoreductase [Bdellovibrionota bacterium]